MNKKEKEQDISITPVPAAAPEPSPVPSETSALTAEKKRKKTESMKYGLMSTVKAGAGGVTGGGADLISSAATGKKTLGG